MLIRFAVENFMSFKNMTELSMVAGKITRHSNHIALCNDKRILKGAYMFGANAGGKTNLIRALAFAKSVIVQGLENTNCDKKYFRIISEYKHKPGVFQFDIFSGGHFYSYGFAVSYVTASIEEEWLYRIDGKEEYCVFLRSKSEDGKAFTLSSDIIFEKQGQQERFNVYADDISSPKMKKTLFLSDVIMRSPDKEVEYQPFRDVMDWFSRLIILFPNSKYEGITQLLDDDNERTRLENLLEYFDTGIESVSKKDVEFDKIFSMLPEKILESMKTDILKELKGEDQRIFLQHESSLIEVKYKDGELLAHEVVSNHGNREDLFEYIDESDGTQRLFDLIPIYQKALENCVVIIDELDRSLHTKVSLEFIKYFYTLTEQNASQLIVTTHDSNIMDLDVVRQDEIWFVERQRDHSSNLYSLNKFKARFDKKVEKEYLLGRYGAIPIFRQIALIPNVEEEGVTDAENNQ